MRLPCGDSIDNFVLTISAFVIQSKLRDHQRTHSGERPFLCSICGKGFSQNASLKQHMMRHSQSKPYQCGECPKAFVSKGELNSHQRIHDGAHPFVCDICGSGFTTSSSMVCANIDRRPQTVNLNHFLCRRSIDASTPANDDMHANTVRCDSRHSAH